MPPQPSQQPTAFGRMLRDHRRAAGWTQTQLVKRTAETLQRLQEERESAHDLAMVSRRAISDIESGVTREPHDATVRILALTLPLDDAAREAFIRAGRAGGAGARPRHNLPQPLSSFIGRARDVAATRAALNQARLVTLTGPGGGGKTRLVLAAATGLVSQYPDGVWLVDLAALTDPALVPQEVARTLGIRAQAPQPLVDTVLAWGRGRRFLLVLDNCEHLIAPCAELAQQLLQQCPGLRILATSREPLRVVGEQVRPVAPLGLPPDTARPTVEAVLAAESAQLFVARAREVAPAFTVTPQNAAALARICHRVEGLPLALELIAARLTLLSPEQIAARLDQLFALAADGPPIVVARHRTLRAALDWSHDLLDDAERAVLRRLAVFAGGCTLEAAEALCADEALPHERIFGLLSRLVQRSLVVAEPGAAGGNRYRLLEPIRQYAAERLAASDEHEALGRRHLHWCVELCERVAAPLDGGPAVRAWLAELDREFANLWAALHRAWASDPAVGVRLAGAAWPYFFVRGDHVAGRQLLRAALAIDAAPARWRGQVRLGIGVLELFDDVSAARTHLDEALALAQQAGDEGLQTDLHWPLAFVGLVTGVSADVQAHLTAGWALAERSGKPGLRSRFRLLQGFVALGRGDLGGGRAELALAYAEAVAADQPLYQAMALARLGGASLKLGLVEEAIADFIALRRAADDLGSSFYRTVATQRLGAAYEWAGDLAAAEAAYREALVLNEESGGNRLERAASLMGLGRVALYHGDHAHALARLRESAVLIEQLRHRPLARDLAYPLGLALWGAGQRSAARVELMRALALRAEGGDRASLASLLEGLAALATGVGAATRAATWLGAMAALRAREEVPCPRVEESAVAAARAATEAVLGAAAYACAACGGAALPIEDVVADARAWLAALPG